ncbi:T9SS type A sorting domain-containing protein [Limnospira fusiformis]|uniref:T9SS type A sorting domain-containing protein n=1 Tax=Limnospira fusiformis TaxID=54297 RepID=UPI001448B652|nr:T9SS type A sorting domain-containing protein [Limnospira fusiformis SAG 85.79]
MAAAITFALGNLADHAVYVGFMGKDAIDIYTFNHPVKGRLNCSVEGFSAGVELRLKTARGRLVSRQLVQPNEGSAIAFNLPAGVYVLEIAAADGNTTYQLTLQQERDLAATETIIINPSRLRPGDRPLKPSRQSPKTAILASLGMRIKGRIWQLFNAQNMTNLGNFRRCIFRSDRLLALARGHPNLPIKCREYIPTG